LYKEATKAFTEILKNVREFKQEKNIKIYIVNTDKAFIAVKNNQ